MLADISNEPPLQTPRALRYAAFASLAVIGFVACSDDNKTTVEELGNDGATLPPGVTLPSGLPGVTDDCQATFVQFITTMAAASTPGAQIDYEQAFGELAASLPEDLHDDLTVLSNAYQAYGAVLIANNNDTSNPNVQAAIQTLATPEVSAAGANIQAYFDATCPDAT